jgi:HEAT repeat protein
MSASDEVLSPATFERWATEDAARLLEYLRAASGSPVLLGEAAEIAGDMAEPNVAGELLKLIKHPSVFVREGAVYGLSKQMLPEFRPTLEELAATETSPAVRAALIDALAT